MPPSNYTCSVNTLDNSITVTLINSIDSTFSLRIKTYIINPSRVIKSVYIKTLLLYGQQGILAETGKSDPVLTTISISFSMTKLNMAWNINPANSSSFPFPVQMVRTDSQAGYLPYNSFILSFSVQTTTPTNIKLRINVNLFTDLGSTFLLGSISETLPSFNSNTAVSCVLVSSNDATRQLQCSGVGQLIAGNKYQIGFKMY